MLKNALIASKLFEATMNQLGKSWFFSAKTANVREFTRDHFEAVIYQNLENRMCCNYTKLQYQVTTATMQCFVI